MGHGLTSRQTPSRFSRAKARRQTIRVVIGSGLTTRTSYSYLGVGHERTFHCSSKPQSEELLLQHLPMR